VSRVAQLSKNKLKKLNFTVLDSNNNLLKYATPRSTLPTHVDLARNTNVIVDGNLTFS